MDIPEFAPNPIDVHVGARIRMRRKFQKLSQQDVANALGLTFQQVQKYERGANRVSASKLFEIAIFLKVPVTYFFDGYGKHDDEGEWIVSASEEAISNFLTTPEGIELARLFPLIKTAKQRRSVLSLVAALAEDND